MDRTDIRFGFWPALLLAAALPVMQVLLTLLAYDISGGWEYGDPMFSGLVGSLSISGLLVAVLTFYKLPLRSFVHPDHIPVQSLVPAVLPLLLTVGAAFVLLVKLDNLLVMVVPYSQAEIDMFSRLLGGGAWSWLAVVIAAPLFEELLFRGVILRGLANRYSGMVALQVSAVLFALIHLNVHQLPAAYAIGLLTGWLYLRTGSLVPCIAAHAANNFLAMASTTVAESLFDVSISSEPFLHPVGIDIVAAVLLFVGVRRLAHALRTVPVVTAKVDDA